MKNKQITKAQKNKANKIELSDRIDLSINYIKIKANRERDLFYLHQIFKYIAVITKHNGFYIVKLDKLINNNKQFILNQNAL